MKSKHFLRAGKSKVAARLRTNLLSSEICSLVSREYKDKEKRGIVKTKENFIT